MMNGRVGDDYGARVNFMIRQAVTLSNTSRRILTLLVAEGE